MCQRSATICAARLPRVVRRFPKRPTHYIRPEKIAGWDVNLDVFARHRKRLPSLHSCGSLQNAAELYALLIKLAQAINFRRLCGPLGKAMQLIPLATPRRAGVP